MSVSMQKLSSEIIISEKCRREYQKLERIDKWYQEYHSRKGILGLSLIYLLVFGVFALSYGLSIAATPIAPLHRKKAVLLQLEEVNYILGILTIPPINRTATQNESISDVLLSQLEVYNSSNINNTLAERNLISLPTNNYDLIMSNETLLSEVINDYEDYLLSKLQYEFNTEQATTVWVWSLVTGIVSMAFIFITGLLLLFFRNNVYLKCKSTKFIVIFHTSALGVILVAVLYSGVFFLKVHQNENDVNYIDLWLFFYINMYCFFLYTLVGAIIARQRLIYLCLQPFQLEFSHLEFFKPFVVVYVVYFVATLPIVICYILMDKHGESNTGINFANLGHLVFIGVLLPICMSFYIYKTRKGAQKYSDYYTNVRAVLLVSLSCFLYFTITWLFHSSTASCLLLQYAIQYVTVIYCIDVNLAVVYTMFKESCYDWNSTENNRCHTMASNKGSSSMSAKSNAYTVELTGFNKRNGGCIVFDIEQNRDVKENTDGLVTDEIAIEV